MEIFLIPVDNKYCNKNEASENKDYSYKSMVKNTMRQDEYLKSQCTTKCPSVSSESDEEEFPKLTACLKSNWLYRVKLCKSISQNKMKLKMKKLAFDNYNFVYSKIN